MNINKETKKMKKLYYFVKLPIYSNNIIKITYT